MFPPGIAFSTFIKEINVIISDLLFNDKLAKSGDTMTGNLNGLIFRATQGVSIKSSGSNEYYGSFVNTKTPLTDHRLYEVPDKSGTLALTSDINTQYAVYEFSGWFLRCARVGKVVVWVFDGTTAASLPAWVYCQVPWTINASVLNSKTDTISIAEGDDKIKITRNVSTGESIRAYGIFSIR